MPEFLKALTVAARSPLAMVGYLAALIAWLVLALTTRRASLLYRAISSLPEADRLHAVELEYKVRPRSGLSAEQWIRSRVHLYLFAGFGITCFLLLALVSYAIWLKEHSPQGTGKNIVSIEHSTINQPGVVGIVDQAPEKSERSADIARQPGVMGTIDRAPANREASEGIARPEITTRNSVEVHNPTIVQPGIVGTVVGNVYVTYQQAKTDAAPSAIQLSDLKFTTDDVGIDEARTTLAIRFSVFNSTPSDISIFDMKCVEYTRGHHFRMFETPRAGEPARRYELLIDTAHPFINRDETIPILANGSRSFHVDLRVFPDINLTEVTFGVVIYYHDRTGNIGKLKSDKLYFALPTLRGVASFDENSINDAYSSLLEKTPTVCGFEGKLKNCKHEPLFSTQDDLSKALLLHRNL
jgi:hypothetical protein